MEEETDFVIVDGVVVPESALLQRKRNRYGSVPGLDDEELADPQELERQVYREELGPVLLLPTKERSSGFRPAVDESGVDWSAFATVDFERTMPAFDKARYKAEKLREELKDILILLGIVKDRLPKAKYLVFKYLRMGIIELEHIVSDDMLAAARMYLRVRRMQREIARLSQAGRTKTAVALR